MENANLNLQIEHGGAPSDLGTLRLYIVIISAFVAILGKVGRVYYVSP